MKRRTINLILSLFSVFLAVALFGFGVYAATSATSTINSTFRFEVPPDAVFVDIVGTVSGCENEDSIRNYVHEYEDTEYFLPWIMNEDLFFKKIGEDNVEDIVYTFNIKNYNENKGISVEFVQLSESTKVNLTPSQTLLLDGFTGDYDNVPSGKITMTLSLNGVPSSFNQEFSFTLKINLL